MGKRLLRLKKHLIELNEFHKNRLIHEETSGMRRIASDSFELVNLCIYLPYKQIILQPNLSLRISRHECLFITGKTGCGKTSLMRICAGLWPLKAQYINIPIRNNLIFIPQRPYLPIGSLRFQVELLFTRKSTLILTDNDINHLFKLVNMNYILQRYNLDEVLFLLISIIICKNFIVNLCFS
jgi:ABC-type uncharacterized transport system fused permease/ATPase subunit